MKKTWMNIRRPLIKHYGIKDKTYTQDMLELEEKNALPEDFSIPGY